MCPLWPFHILLFYFMTFIPIWVMCQSADKLLAEFDPQKLNMQMDTTQEVWLNISNLNDFKKNDSLRVYSNKDHIATSDFDVYQLTSEDVGNPNWEKKFHVSANFLGKTAINVEICKTPSNDNCIKSDNTLEIIVTRGERVIDHIFTGSVIMLVSLIYINFGCALDWEIVKQTLRRPIGPAIGFVTQFLFMPLLSFGFGKWLFPDNYEMQLGMFFTGVSPGGGASNIWTYILGGNLNLSITMTTISTLAAFGMMPLWLFTLGRTIFKSGDMKVPYSRIGSFALGLIIPLGLGLLAQRYLPKFAKLMVRILKSFSALLIIFIIVFAIVTNIYLFELFSWRIVVAGLCVPWLGYLFGFLSSHFLRQPMKDSLAIALETGIQNTGIAIFLLRFSLDQPAADLTTVIPVSIAIMTPVPLMIMFVYLFVKRRFFDISTESSVNGDEREKTVSDDASVIVDEEANVNNGKITPVQ